jgi:Tannase and feruloyl esterase
MGHQGMDPAWGADSQKRVDFAHRGVHATVLAAKALIRAFYGQAPRYSYFSGCSDGGREALIEAQRYPGDFDGIAAGAPALNFTVQNSFHHAWLAKANTGLDGKRLLVAVDMKPLHDAVLKACDAIDGLVDGQITDPRLCHYDPAPLRCKQSYVAGTCLTREQIAAVRKIYSGAIGPRGERLEVGPLMRGSEMEWIGVFVPIDRGAPVMSAMFALGTINNLLFTPNPQPAYTIANFPFNSAMYAREEAARALYSADDPNLTRFAAHGGRLILWHGWSDPHISPINTIDYYGRAGRVMGEAARDQAIRLFLLPGMGHCAGGDGPSEFPLLAALMSWVETGQKPQVLIARRSEPSLEGLTQRTSTRSRTKRPATGGERSSTDDAATASRARSA